MEVFRSTKCPSCGKELKVCLNCRFYAPRAHYGCLETIDEEVREKDRANFCSYFVFQSGAADNKDEKKKGKAQADFRRLFGEEQNQ